jgi:molybdopterin-guanine dinucleotide biosynthesis adapter protein
VANPPPLIGIVGWKGSGKTTLIERLVAALNREGLRIATVKHTHHELRPHDETTDGERHARAGAVQTAMLSPSQWELGGKLQPGAVPALEEIVKRFGPVDLILVEGFKRAPIPKIEVRREAAATREPIAPGDADVLAIAADHTIEDATVPVFALDDIAGIAAFILDAAGLQKH